jgi:uncharacterized membrane protein
MMLFWRQSVADRETTRVEAFSDGVFAIAATLLVLEFQVPKLGDDVTPKSLLVSLIALWPSLLAFIVSFLSILVMWVNHHGVFDLVRAADSRFKFANGMLLPVVTFIPFPTAVLARHINDCGAPTAAAFYCGTHVVLSLAYIALWRTARTNRHLIKRDVPDAHLQKIDIAYKKGLVVYIIAMAMSYINAYMGLAICLSLWVLWVILNYSPHTVRDTVHDVPPPASS